jgi:serine protease Do
MAGSGLLAASLCGAVIAAQGRGSGDAQAQRDAERGTQIHVDGFGASIGATVRDVSPEEAQRAKLSPAQGAYVTRVEPAGAAEKAGIAIGDIIVEFDGEPVRSARQLSRLVRESADDRAVKSVVVRDGSRRTVDLAPGRDRVVATLPDFHQLDQQFRDLARQFEFSYNGRNGNAWGGFALGARGRLGVSLTPVSDQLAAYFGVQRGVLVSSVEADSPAGHAGLKAGDVITAVNDHQVSQVSDVLDEIRRANAGASIALIVTRERKELKLTAKIPETPARPERIERGRSI